MTFKLVKESKYINNIDDIKTLRHDEGYISYEIIINNKNDLCNIYSMATIYNGLVEFIQGKFESDEVAFAQCPYEIENEYGDYVLIDQDFEENFKKYWKMFKKNYKDIIKDWKMGRVVVKKC